MEIAPPGTFTGSPPRMSIGVTLLPALLTCHACDMQPDPSPEVRTTVTQATQENQAPNATTPTPGRSRAAAVASAGPLLIVAVTLFVLRHYPLEPRMDSSDMTNYWLPLHCFMGSTLRAGHIPGWNPFA